MNITYLKCRVSQSVFSLQWIDHLRQRDGHEDIWILNFPIYLNLNLAQFSWGKMFFFNWRRSRYACMKHSPFRSRYRKQVVTFLPNMDLSLITLIALVMRMFSNQRLRFLREVWCSPLAGWLTVSQSTHKITYTSCHFLRDFLQILFLLL